jgi:hypothetical protein
MPIDGAGNTALVKCKVGDDGSAVSIWYYKTPIITYFYDRVVKVNPDGYFTASCKERLNRYLSGRGGCSWHRGDVYVGANPVWHRGTDRRGAWNGGQDRWSDRRPYYLFPTFTNPEAATSGVIGLCRGMAADDDYSRLPILADALEEAGPTALGNPNVLAALRSGSYADGPNDLIAKLIDRAGGEGGKPADFTRKAVAK